MVIDNRVRQGHSDEMDCLVMVFTLDEPTQGCTRVAQELALKGVNVSLGSVRGVLEPLSAAFQARAASAPGGTCPQASGRTHL